MKLKEIPYNGDHATARFLRSKGWNGKYTHINSFTTDFKKDNGAFICRIVYNNRESRVIGLFIEESQ